MPYVFNLLKTFEGVMASAGRFGGEAPFNIVRGSPGLRSFELTRTGINMLESTPLSCSVEACTSARVCNSVGCAAALGLAPAATRRFSCFVETGSAPPISET